MSFAIAAAGTGGHVYPGLAVAEALLDIGVEQSEITFLGGSRLAKTVYPREGFRFVELELRGLQRSLTPRNLTLPWLVARAVRDAGAALEAHGARVVLAMGGYVAVPIGLAARRRRIPFFLQEQNAHAGLANRLVGRLAHSTFTAFPETVNAVRPRHVGNPLRRELAEFSRSELRRDALQYYGLEPGPMVVGIVGGSLGARAINEAAVAAFARWDGPPIQVIHLAGREHETTISDQVSTSSLPWIVRGFETRMDLFFAASDLLVARAGGMVAEIAATGTPAILVPGGFGSGGHQDSNARAFERTGAALVVSETELFRLRSVVEDLAQSPSKRREMSDAARTIGKRSGARVIAEELISAHT
jgi:UDP-N-acetylglucosamine--N-acetylmuramyl-(pentapeptide) pyrophosphoryl-undecaprenol N-acetylglucosamine transferase